MAVRPQLREAARQLAPLALLLLAACAAAPPVRGLRDPAVPVRSIAGYDFAQMAGTWHQAAYLAPPSAPGCAPGRLSVRPEGAALRLTGTLCLAGVARPADARAVPSGPGRLALSGEAEDWWVIWADHGNRTLVLAPPSGRFAVVLDRGQLPPDRLKAAREVLDFNGFDIGLMR